ncbi:TetR/AcrR family transcriptional regulator [Burkholderia sp. MSMB1835]|uniref:TetR/AcrR family transcriptional regulator n=1 Tax=Burkholderia sp. MSMB1835 TaxID=1637876 RepID=UPI000752105A|nr:TetR/AcrR family transcriptional regulator [Burkholderia sp. MSMB1835]KVL37252.1 TetR family transcriptional regulator [Burkholderia sp. MSMB1835]
MEPNLPIISRIHRAAFELFAQKGETQVSISELAQAAGIARGTVYNHVPSPEALFETVAAQMAEEMHERVVASFVGITDPAQRLANGIRYFIRRAHEEPHWGRFLSRFAFSDDTLQGLWTGPTMRDVVAGLEQQRYNFRPEQLHSAMAVIAGSALASIVLVLDGHRTWRDAGSDTAELVLRSLGVDNETARRHATAELPPLAELP